MDPYVFSLCKELSEDLIKSIDIRKLLKSKKFKNFSDSITNHLDGANMLGSSLHKNFNLSIICSMCNTDQCDIELFCNHRFCKTCISRSINIDINLISYYKSINKISCPLCYETTDVNDVISQVLAEEKISCQECRLSRAIDQFYYKCNHMCVFCGFHNLKYKKSCKFCGCDKCVLDFSKYIKGILCSGCNIKKNIAESIVIEICNGHSHCYECLKTAWKTMKCKYCYEILDSNTLNLIKRKIFAECFNCKNEIEIGFLVKKNCCEPNICFFCQKEFSTDTCLNCHEKLEYNIVRKISF